jgi:flavoprotein hydroxylase
VLVPQARITYRGRTGLFDHVVGGGFVLAGTEDPSAHLGADERAFLDAIGTRRLHLVAPGARQDAAGGDRDAGGPALDVDGTYRAYLAAAGGVAALIRPDHYLFGTVPAMSDLSGLVAELRRQLTGRGPIAPSDQPETGGSGREST